jgi:polyferredoxin
MTKQTTVRLSPRKYAVYITLLIIMSIVVIWLAFAATPWLDTLDPATMGLILLAAMAAYVLIAAAIGGIALSIQARQDRRQSKSTPE